jgi:hypothetical protein
MNSFFGFVVGVLQSTLSLLGFVQQHPEIPADQQQQVQEVAKQAVTQASNAISQRGNANDSPNTAFPTYAWRFTEAKGNFGKLFKIELSIVGKTYPIGQYYGCDGPADEYGDKVLQQPSSLFCYSGGSGDTIALTYKNGHIVVTHEDRFVEGGPGEPVGNSNVQTVLDIPNDPHTNDVSVPGMSKYTDSDFGFSFWYPSEWKVIKGRSGSGSFSDPQIRVMSPPFDNDALVDMYIDEHAGSSTYAYQPVMTYLSMGDVSIFAYYESSLPQWYTASWGSPLKSLDITGRGIMLPLLRTIVASNSAPISDHQQIGTIEDEKAAYMYTGSAQVTPSDASIKVDDLPEVKNHTFARSSYSGADPGSLYCGSYTDYVEDTHNYIFSCSVLMPDGHRVTVGKITVDKYTGVVNSQ